ncbi:MAG: efflux RND transporter permease subunit [Chthoniobacteraceae bacterium]
MSTSWSRRASSPQQDNGRVIGNIQADQSISFQAMQQKLQIFVDIIHADPAVSSVVGFTGGDQVNSATCSFRSKPLADRSSPPMR